MPLWKGKLLFFDESLTGHNCIYLGAKLCYTCNEYYVQRSHTSQRMTRTRTIPPKTTNPLRFCRPSGFSRSEYGTQDCQYELQRHNKYYSMFYRNWLAFYPYTSLTALVTSSDAELFTFRIILIRNNMRHNWTGRYIMLTAMIPYVVQQFVTCSVSFLMWTMAPWIIFMTTEKLNLHASKR